MRARLLLASARARRKASPAGGQESAARRKSAGAPLDAAIACAWEGALLLLDVDAQATFGSTARWIAPRCDQASHRERHDACQKSRACLRYGRSGTVGSEILYKELLQIPNKGLRDVFERVTKLQLWYIALQGRLDKFATIRYAKRKLKLFRSVCVTGRGFFLLKVDEQDRMRTVNWAGGETIIWQAHQASSVTLSIRESNSEPDPLRLLVKLANALKIIKFRLPSARES